MHELSIVEGLIEQVEKELHRCGQRGQVLRLDLVIGLLSGVSCDSLRFAFDLLAPGTLVEKAEVHIGQSRAICHCHACNARVDVDEIAVRCPECRSTDVTLEGGRELLLESIEIAD
jgi:hydrogenase nickel incorporation protein HypA/HybF